MPFNLHAFAQRRLITNEHPGTRNNRHDLCAYAGCKHSERWETTIKTDLANARKAFRTYGLPEDPLQNTKTKDPEVLKARKTLKGVKSEAQFKASFSTWKSRREQIMRLDGHRQYLAQCLMCRLINLYERAKNVDPSHNTWVDYKHAWRTAEFLASFEQVHEFIKRVRNHFAKYAVDPEQKNAVHPWKKVTLASVIVPHDRAVNNDYTSAYTVLSKYVIHKRMLENVLFPGITWEQQTKAGYGTPVVRKEMLRRRNKNTAKMNRDLSRY